MSKKNLLNEQTIRRFGGIAGIKPATTSNFLNEEELEVEEEFEEEIPLDDTLADDEEAIEDAEMDLADAEDDLAADVEVDAEQLVLDIVTDVQALADLAGVQVDIEDSGEEELEDIDVEEFGVEDEVEDIEVEEEPTLEEMINSILQEDDDDDEDTLEETESHNTKERRNAKDDRRREKDLKRQAKDLEHDADEDDGDETHNEGRIRVVDDEYLMKEVSRRVKQRLAKLVKEQRRPQRVRRRKK